MSGMIVELAPHSTTDELARRDELAERLRWLIRLRWLALGGVCCAIIGARSLNLVLAIWPLVTISATMGLLNLGFQSLHRVLPVRTLRALSAEALLQSGTDIVGLGLLLFFAGGLANPFIFFFTFHVVIAAILLEKQQAYTVAMLTVGVVIFLGLVDEFGWNASWPLEGALTTPTRLSRIALVFAISTTLLISVYMVHAIMERLRARTGDVRRLNADLAERVEMLAAAERKLAAEHQRARAILECMEEGVVVVDLHGQVLLANTAAQQSALMALDDTLRQAGCHSTEMDECRRQHAADAAAGKPITEESAECPLGNPAACLQDALAKGGYLCPATLALLGADLPKEESPALTPPKHPTLAQIELKGRRFENTVSAVKTHTLKGEETLGLVIVSRDVTERRSLERQVVHAEKLHALGNLAAGLAHELNTPLATILGYAQMLLEDETPPKELTAIEEQTRRCRRIVQSLLDFARKTSSGRTECSANDLATKVRDLLAHTLQIRGIELKLDLSNAPARIFVAADEFEQVLVNIVTNAADAIEMSRPSGERRGGCITIRTRLESSGTVLIAVEDDGPGVPSQIQDEIFEPFFTTKPAGRGTGLGLSIARRIVEDHNGSLMLVNRPQSERGARFEIRVAASRGAAKPVEAVALNSSGH